MRTLHWYLIRQVMATLVMTVAVFTFVFLLGNLLREVVSLLVNRQATLGLVLGAVGLLIPYVLAFTLPFGLLTATLLVFGRCSADQELTAARASGLSLMALSSPVVLLSVFLSLVCGLVNLEVAPRCRIAYKRLLSNLVVEQGTQLLVPGRYNELPNLIIYVGGKTGPERKTLTDVLLYQLKDGQKVSDVRAAKARLAQDEQTGRWSLVLEQAQLFRREDDGDRWQPAYFEELPIELPQMASKPETREPKISEMTFGQLLDRKHELEARLESPSPDASATAADPVRWRTPILVQMHRELAFSFACFGFTLVGIPLGIRAHRRETSAGVALALALVLVYYSFIILGQALETHAQWAPYLIEWVPDFLFQAVGGMLLWRANRRG